MAFVIQAIKKEDGTICLHVPSKHSQEIIDLLASQIFFINLRRPELNKQQVSFRRRAIPFFMVAFEKYVKQLQLEKNDRLNRKILERLAELKSNRSSQHKFELGDLVHLCSDRKLAPQFLPLFECFLGSVFLTNYINNNKKIRNNNQNLYFNIRPILLFELKKSKPFTKFITKGSSQNSIAGQQSQQENQEDNDDDDDLNDLQSFFFCGTMGRVNFQLNYSQNQIY